MFNPEIYKSYDIRGVYPEEFPASEAYHIGRAYAEHTGVKKVVVARDMRPSGDEIEPELIRALTEAGVDVVKIGWATSPLFYFSVHELKVDGGLMVTASHNPGKYNGIKMTRADAVPIAKDTGLMDIRDLVEKREWVEVDKKGDISEADVKEKYLDEVCEAGVADGLKIVVDAGNGMTGMLLEDVFKKIGGEVVSLYWEVDGTFPNHEANPLEEENVKDLQAAVKEHRADLGVAFDGDGDRVFFVTEKADIISGDIMTGLIAQEVLREKPGSTILYDLRASRATREAIEEAHGVAKMSRVGHSYIKAMMREEDAVFAGEVSGHFYFAELGGKPFYAESAVLAMVKLIGILKREGKKLSELVDPLVSRYATSEEINFEVGDKEGAMARIKKKYSDAEMIELDGLTVRYEDWWTNVRPSGTEPLLRMKVEAKTRELLEEKKAEIEKMISE